MTQLENQRRPESGGDITAGTPVEVDRIESGTFVGLVQSRNQYDGWPDRIIVEDSDGGEINTSIERATVVTGKHAELVRDLVGEDDA